MVITKFSNRYRPCRKLRSAGRAGSRGVGRAGSRGVGLSEALVVLMLIALIVLAAVMTLRDELRETFAAAGQGMAGQSARKDTLPGLAGSPGRFGFDESRDPPISMSPDGPWFWDRKVPVTGRRITPALAQHRILARGSSYLKAPWQRKMHLPTRLHRLDDGDFDRRYRALFGRNPGAHYMGTTKMDSPRAALVRKRADRDGATTLHEGLHLFQSGKSRASLGMLLNEGFTEYLSLRFGRPARLNPAYNDHLNMARRLALIAGDDAIARAHFTGDDRAIQAAVDRKFHRGHWAEIKRRLKDVERKMRALKVK